MPVNQTGDHAHIKIGTYNDVGGDQINYFGMLLAFLLSCLALTICTSASHRYRGTVKTCV